VNYPSYPQEEINELRNRAAWLAAVILVIFGFLIVRAWYLQVFLGSHYRGMAEENRIRLVEIPAARGFIYDRNGTLLVNNMPSFNLYLVLEDIPDLQQTLEKLSQFINVSPEDLNERIQSKKNLAPPETPQNQE